MRLIYAGLAAAFTALVLWAVMAGDFSSEFATISSLPWGIVSLVDLYLGFFVFFVLASMIEKSFSKGIAWLLPTLILGNVVPLIYLVLKFKKGLSNV